MGSKPDLRDILVQLACNDNVYFQPPESVKMQYPAIEYSIDGFDNMHANDAVYNQNTRYKVTVIDEEPDSIIAAKVSKLPRCKFDRAFVAGGLNHTVFILYH